MWTPAFAMIAIIGSVVKVIVCQELIMEVNKEEEMRL
jgi:hypothetical protein